jgi:purine-nucleoside phosphorylase
MYLQGRFHYYEGHDLATVTFPVRVLARLGVETLVLTAATGGINPLFRPGDIVCVSDHLNLIGQNPLRGPNDDRLGPRFPDMSEVYSKALRELAREQSARLKQVLRFGVYACLPGPSYETPAEIKMLAVLGADVVGMSTVPEALVARHSGMKVLAFALVTNAAAGVTGEPISHEDVLEAGRQAVPRLGGLIEGVVKRLSEQKTAG